MMSIMGRERTLVHLGWGHLWKHTRQEVLVLIPRWRSHEKVSVGKHLEEEDGTICRGRRREMRNCSSRLQILTTNRRDCQERLHRLEWFTKWITYEHFVSENPRESPKENDKPSESKHPRDSPRYKPNERENPSDSPRDKPSENENPSDCHPKLFFLF